MVGVVSFVGGMNVPMSAGRFNATMPMAELLIDDQRLTLRPRGLLAGYAPFVVRLDRVEFAYRLRGVVMTAGVGIRLRSGLNAYFWTWTQKDAVLASLDDRGITIQPGSHRARGLWTLRGTEGDVIAPTLPTVLQAVALMLVLIGTAAAIVLLVVVGPLGVNSLMIVGLWALVLFMASGLWWAGRRKRGTTT